MAHGYTQCFVRLFLARSWFRGLFLFIIYALNLVPKNMCIGTYNGNLAAAAVAVIINKCTLPAGWLVRGGVTFDKSSKNELKRVWRMNLYVARTECLRVCLYESYEYIYVPYMYYTNGVFTCIKDMRTRRAYEYNGIGMCAHGYCLKYCSGFKRSRASQTESASKL